MRYFLGKLVTWLGAGASHSAAVTVDGGLYAWGSNERGQLGGIHVKGVRDRIGIPILVKDMVGSGMASVVCNYDKTFMFCADPSADTTSDSFLRWKHKFLEHEQNQMVM